MNWLAIILGEVVVLYLLSRKLHLGFGRLFYKLTKSRKMTVYLLAVLFLPGTFIHESAHFLAALFLLVPVSQIELMPELEGESGIKLGSVAIGKADFVRRTIVGVAPLVAGIGIIFGSLYYILTKELLGIWQVYLAVFYLCFQIGNTMYLSRRDLAGAWKFLILLLFIAVALVFLLSFGSIDFVFSEKVTEVFRLASYFFAVPIIIDMCFIAFFKTAKLI